MSVCAKHKFASMAPKNVKRSSGQLKDASRKAKAKPTPRNRYQPRKTLPDDGKPLWYNHQTSACARVEHPDWPKHFLDLFGAEEWAALRQAYKGRLTINVFSDHCGMTTEMFAGRQIRDYLREQYEVDVVFRLYIACDNCPKAKEVTIANHQPVHFTSDVYHRDLRCCTYECDLCEKTHDLPSNGIDIYMSGFPCTPFSSRGTRTGFDHKDGNQYMQTCKTIQCLRPVFFGIENVCAKKKADHDTSELACIIAHMEKELPDYIILSLDGLDPRQGGYPTSKSRFFAVGGRRDQIQVVVFLSVA